jgi:hypothetical protein
VRELRLVTTPKNASYRVDGGEWSQISMGGAQLKLGPGAHRVDVKHPLCADQSFTVGADDTELRNKVVVLPWRPTRVRARCEQASAIGINDRPVQSGDAVDILDFKGGRAQVTVDFVIDGVVHHKVETVTAGDPVREVKCDGG